MKTWFISKKKFSEIFPDTMQLKKDLNFIVQTGVNQWITTFCGKDRIKVKIPIRIVSEANLSGEHWTKKHKRHKTQKNAIRLFLNGKIDETWLPCVITLTRIAPRELDDDNLSSSMKHIRDYVCDILVPGKQMGRADSDKRIQVKYEQKKGIPKEYAVEVEVIKND